jgi:hypothetical protein
MDVVSITQVLAGAVCADALLEQAAVTVYGKPFTVEIGFDRRRTEWRKIAPFVVFAPLREAMEGSSRLYSVGVLLGVVDEFIVPDPVTMMRGFAFIAQQAVPHAMAAMQGAVPALLRRCTLHEPEVEFVQDEGPLFFCNIALTIEESLPIGGRR